MAKAYDANAIEGLVYPDFVRKRPDMYMGATTGKYAPALYRCLREIIDNSLDEYIIGHNNLIVIDYSTESKICTVIDNGRGIPTGINKKTGKSALWLVFGQMHAGGKFDKESYKISAGKNGVGNKGTNALSKWLVAYSNNNDKRTWMHQAFVRGVADGEVTKGGCGEFEKWVKDTGTIVRFLPDAKIFEDGIDMDINRLKRELDDVKYLCPKLCIKLFVDGAETDFYSESGLADMVSEGKDKEIIFSYSAENIDAAINFTQREGSSFRSYVNNVYTDMGGTHLKGFRKAICDIVKENSKKSITNDDILEGMVGAIHFKMADPQYQGQTKNELTTVSAEKDVQDLLDKPLRKFFRDNKSTLDRIVKFAEKMYDERQKMKASKDMLKGLNKLNNAAKYISEKFSDADRRKYRNVDDLEMFVVEGDSAGGHFKQAREGFQACLKLRGKIINAAKATQTQLFGSTKKGSEQDGNREIKDLTAALGCGVLDQYDESKLRFSKLIIMCFTGDTKVKLLNGTEKTFEELVEYEREHPDSEYWVYSVDENGSFVPGKAIHPRITGYVDELIEITLDNGSSFKCTPDHLLMLRDGTYKEARKITTTDSLMPLYTKINDGRWNNGRELYYDNFSNKWEFTHRSVMKNFGTFESYVSAVEKHLANADDDTKARIESLRNSAKDTLQNRISGNVFTKKNSMARIGKLIFDRGLEFNSVNYSKIRSELGAVRTPLFDRYNRYYDSYENFREYCKNYNHKIVSKKSIKLDSPVPVYDLTVEKYHNFILGGGSQIVVHNCDSDSDGSHIVNLILSFLIKYMPDLIKNGHVYTIDAPLFVANGANCRAYGDTRNEVEKKMKEAKCKQYTITRMKGWGECNADDLATLCISPKTRKLIQMKYDDKTLETLEQTMAGDSEFRKVLLEVK